MFLYDYITEKIQNNSIFFNYIFSGRPKKEKDGVLDNLLQIINDKRKYKSYFCENPAPSVKGYLRVMDRHKFHHLSDDWDIFIPNGYNKIEEDLKDFIPQRDDQIILAIPGCDNIVSKANIWTLLENKYGREKAKEIMPETFVLDNQSHMELFEKMHVDGNMYIMKKKKQRKEGLLLTKSLEDVKDGISKEYTIVQNYNRNVLLVNDRKVNLRVYLMLTIQNSEVKAYVNKYGNCIYNNKTYDDSVMDFESNITSFNLSLDIYDKNPLTIKQLKTYLLDKGYENPDILFERLDEKVRLMCDAVKDSIGTNKEMEKNLCIQIFGMDFIVDKDLNPYLLECNKGPDMTPKIDTTYAKIINNLEKFYENESIVDKSYPDGYKSGNGLKVQRDMFKFLNIIEEIDVKDNGFYEVYSGKK